jgi:hypothetical protein
MKTPTFNFPPPPKGITPPTFKAQFEPNTKFPVFNTASSFGNGFGDIEAKLAEQLKAMKDKHSGKGKKQRKRHDIRLSIIFAFDTEYQYYKDEDGNIILAYSYCIRYDGRECSGVFKVYQSGKSTRMKFDKFFVKAIEAAIEAEVLSGWGDVEHVVMAAFMIRADLFSFAGAFKDFKTRLDGVRKAVVTIKEDYAVDIEAVYNRDLDFNEQKLWDKNRNQQEVDISFYDLMLLAPAGFNLKQVGELVGLEKIDIKHPHSIERMIEFMEQEPELFDEYSIRDSEIAALYMERMIEFCCDELGLSSVPYTIGGIGVKRFKSLLEGDFDEVFGYEEIEDTHWSDNKATPVTIKKRVVTLLRSIFDQFATEGYHGGRNESFLNGLSPRGYWRDYDAPSCYTVILNMLRPLDYSSFKTTKNPQDFVGDKFGIAYVKFKHHGNPRVTTLPVSAGNKGLFYVKEGECVVGAPEIEVALNAGVELEIIQGVVGDWIDPDNRIFLPFMEEVRAQRNKYPNGSFEERMWKEIGNSLYGKLAQGLRKRAVFDTASGLSKQIPQSQITNPYFAMHVTSAARALMTEMMLSIPDEHYIGNVTTDGFTTTANLDKGEINLDGVICQRFRECYHMIESSDKEILVKKHAIARGLFMKNRGQETVEAIDGENQIQARAGVSLPKNVVNKHAHMNGTYLDRVPGQYITSKHLISSREMFIDERDFVSIERKQKMNLEWDMKRELVNPVENTAKVTVEKIVGTTVETTVKEVTHIFCETVPHTNLEEALAMRARFDGWRKNNCLKRLTDWDSWEDYWLTSSLTLPTGIRYQYLKGNDGKVLKTDDGQKVGEGSDGVLRRLFIRAFMQNCCGLDHTSMERKALADWLSACGYDTTENEVRGAARALFVENAVPVTEKSLKLLRLLLQRFPEFEYESLFDPSKLDELERRLNL